MKIKKGFWQGLKEVFSSPDYSKIKRKRYNWPSEENKEYCTVHGLKNYESVLDIEYDSKTGEAIKVVYKECPLCPPFGSW